MIRKVLLVFAVMLLVMCLAGCKGNPSKPEPDDKQYLVYFYRNCDYEDGYCNESPILLAYNPYTDVLDTFPLPVAPSGDLGIAPDGSVLYMPTESAVAVVDAKTQAVVTELPYPEVHYVAVSGDGSMIALMSDSLTILKTSDYSLVYRDTVEVGLGSFSDDCGRFYYAGREDIYMAACIVTLDSSLEKTCRLITGSTHAEYVWQFEPSKDETKWFNYSEIGFERWVFGVIDLSLDTSIFVHLLIPGLGEFEVTPDERYIFYTNPGGMIGSLPPPFQIYVYDVMENRLADSIGTLRVENDSVIEYLTGGDIAITPDGKWLVALTRYGGRAIIVVDVTTREFVRYVDVGGGPYLFSATCQTRL